MAKILILLAQDICHGLLDSMALNMGYEILKMGIEVQYFDIKKEAPESIVNYYDKCTIAIIDFYSGMLNITLADGNKYFDVINIPVYQFLFDYPIYVENILGCKLKNYHALCMDRDYVAALEQIYAVKKAFFFPIPGKEGNSIKSWSERGHELVFVGVYVNYREILAAYDECENNVKQFALDYFNTMIRHTNLNHMDALKVTLDDKGIKYDNDILHRFFLQYGKIGRASRAYIREQMIVQLLEAGFDIDVYSDSWKNDVLNKYDNLIIHDVINEDEYLKLLGDSKISLNCLYGNKAGFTERHGNSMLNGAISVTDRTDYLAENFMDQEDIIFYDLDIIDQLPRKIKWLLDNPVQAELIADKARIKAMQYYTWTNACERFLQILVRELEG